MKDISDKIDIIIENAHFFNWAPYLDEAQEIYNKFPDYYSVIIPFFYTYLEELIRSNTSQYGREILDKNGKEKYRITGVKLIELAIKENPTNQEMITELNNLKKYFEPSTIFDSGNNRNSTLHGYMHPRFWTEDSFRELIDDIARFSKFSNF